MKRLLSFKPWQLFLLIFICGAWTSPSPLKEIINSVAVVTFTLWIYAIGVYGQERITALGLQPMNTRLFKINVVVVGALFLIGSLWSALQGEAGDAAAEAFGLADLLYVLGGFYLVFAVFQTILFSCKTIAKLELRREVSFGDYVNHLLLMLFFFVGVWILQPKVTRLIANQEDVAF